jgi:hypothetical protein
MTIRPFAIVAFMTILPAFAARGETQMPGGATISGVVHDTAGGALPGVTVTAAPAESDASETEVTDSKGIFRFNDLRPGSYTIAALLDGMKPVARRIAVTRDQALDLKLTMAPAISETVTVTAKAARTGEIAILQNRREAPVVSDSISSEEIRKTPDSTAAGVVERLTGVTLLGDKYVFVRGLGERYSGTTINGATLPTTETEKRVVPLDLFPAKLLQTVNVVT